MDPLKIYKGDRLNPNPEWPDRDTGAPSVAYVNNKPLKQYFSNGRASEFNWGYGGEGPHQTASAILFDATHDRKLTERLALDFMQEITSKWKNSWTITDVTVENFLAKHGEKEAAIQLSKERFAAWKGWQPGDVFTKVINQGPRECEVLAKLGNEVMVEYEMPAGGTSLFIMPAKTSDIDKLRHHSGGYKNVSYSSIPTKWLEALVKEDVNWIGNPQQSRKNPPTPADLLAQRKIKVPGVARGQKKLSRHSAGIKSF